MSVMSQRDYYEYGTIRNLTIVVPVMGSMIDSKMGPIEREEMHRADQIDLRCARRQRNERRPFKGY